MSQFTFLQSEWAAVFEAASKAYSSCSVTTMGFRVKPMGA